MSSGGLFTLAHDVRVAMALDINGDMALSSAGLPFFIGGADEAIQRLRVRFLFFLGEWYRDTRLGVPYFEHVLIKRPNLTLVLSLWRQLILDTPGITRLKRLTQSFDKTTRTLRPVFEAVFEDGTVISDEDVLPTLLPLEVP